MAPSNNKRKRGGERSSTQDDGDDPQRPSPHRPDELPLARNDAPGRNRQQEQRSPTTRGGRRGGRGRDRNSTTASIQPASKDLEQPPNSAIETRATPQNSSTAANDGALASAATPTVTEGNPAISAPEQSTPGPALSVAQPPATPSAPYDYSFLTDERIQAWDKSGRLAVIAEAREALEKDDYIQLSAAFQEFLAAGLYGRITAEDAGKLVSETIAISGQDSNPEASALFLDTLSIAASLDMTNPRLRAIASSTGIPTSLMRNQLDEKMLVALGLVRSTFEKVFIRQQTNSLYRQSNYNLLREETEGYSKLITELFTVTNSGPPTDQVAKDTFEKIKALVGAFDLDAGRVLDVILDVFATLLVKHYRFFVKLLRTSSWWPLEQGIHKLATESQGFGSLPTWAQPGHSGWNSTDEDKARIAALKEERDQRFWDRAREVGMNAFFELGQRKVLSDQEVLDHLDAAAQSEDERTKDDYDWIKATRTMPPPGNPVAAQLLGFKLRFYASDARDANDTLPHNIIYLAALLIKIGFISLRDLYPHLYPTDENLEQVGKQQLKELEKQHQAKLGSGANNALARAGALPDDTVPPPPSTAASRLREAETRGSTPSAKLETRSRAATPAATTEESPKKDSKEQLPEPDDQKVNLLRSLLCIGALPEALYIIGRFPWIVDAYTDIPKHLYRIIHHSLHKVYDPLCPLQGRESLRESRAIASVDQSGMPKGDLRMETPNYRMLRWAKLDAVNPEDGTDYRFYWDDWNDNVPVCQSVEDVFTLCGTFLNICGVKIGQDPTLLVKLARIGKNSLLQDPSEHNKSRWADLCKRLLCPALSLTDNNPDAVNEVWEIVKQFSTKTRYAMYAEWFLGGISRSQDVKRASELTAKRAKDVLKRLSTENVRDISRALAKTACASPGVVFLALVKQIESYGNQSSLIVECGRYFTYMGYDVLNWVLLNSLSPANRERTAPNGVSPTDWLDSLTKFVGKVFKRFAMINMVPILQYTLDQLRRNNFGDLRVLEQIIAIVSGIIRLPQLTDNEVETMSGGEVLRSLALQQAGDRRHESKSAARRLTTVLLQNDLAGPFLVSIAQQRDICIFESGQDAPKVMGEHFDRNTTIFVQYLDLLRATTTVSEFNEATPPLNALIGEYGLEPSVAFAIQRKSIADEVDRYDASHPKRIKDFTNANLIHPLDPENQEAGEQKVEKIATENSTEDEESQKEAKDQTSHPKPAVANGAVDTAMTDVEPAPPTEADSSAVGKIPAEPWHPALQKFIDEIQPVVDADIMENMGLQFYLTFWQLSLRNIHASSSRYTDAIKFQESKLAMIKSDKSDMTSSAIKRRDQEYLSTKKSVDVTKTQILAEMKQHIDIYESTKARLDLESKYWFKGFIGKWPQLEENLVTHCFFPRLVMSEIDARYTFRFFMMMHSLGTVQFRTMHVLDLLLDEKTITNLIFKCTPSEARNLALFLNEVFGELHRWREDPPLYEKQAHGVNKDLLGFANLTLDGKVKHHIHYDEFRRLYFKWHKQLLNALLSLLRSIEYVHVKNAMTVLEAMQHNFPTVNFHGYNLLAAVDKHIPLHEATARNPWTDIQLLARSMNSILERHRPDWIIPQAFRLNDAAAAKGQQQSSHDKSAQSMQPLAKSDDAKSTIGQQADMTKNRVKPSSAGTVDVEDGEVEDVDMADSGAKIDSKNEAGASSGSHSSNTPTQRQSAGEAANKSSDLGRSMDASSQRTEAGQISNVPPTPQSSDGAPKDGSGADATASRVPHALPNRPEGPTPAFRRPQGRSGIHTPERPDSRSRSRAHPPPDLMQSRLDERQRAPNGPADSYREVNRSFDSQPQRGIGESNTGPTTRTMRHSNGPHDDIDVLQRPSSASGMGGHDRQDTRNFREPYQNSRSGVNAYHQSEHDYRSSDRSRGPGPNGAAFSGPRPYAREQPSSQDNRAPQYSRNAPIERGDTRQNAPYPARGDASRELRPDGPGRLPSYDHRTPQAPPLRDFSADNAPSGPRSGRPPRSGLPRDGVPLESTRPPTDNRHDRNPQDHSRPSRQQDDSYGRLNSEPVRNQGQQQSPPNSMPSSGTGTSLTPSETRAPARSQPHQTSHSIGTDGGADALRNSGGGEVRPPVVHATASSTLPNGDKTVSDTAGMHPERLARMEPSRPPPIQTAAAPASGPSTNSTVAPPSGPRSVTQRPQVSQSPTTTLPSPSGRRPPAGPRGTDRRFANLQDTLQQNAAPMQAPSQPGVERSEDRGTSIRGRAVADRQAQTPTTRSTDAGALPQALSRDADSSSTAAPPTERNGDNENRRRGPAPPDRPQASRDQEESSEQRDHNRGQDVRDHDRNREKDRNKGNRESQRTQDRERDREHAGRPRREGEEGRDRFSRGGDRDRDGAPRERDASDAQHGNRERTSGKGAPEEDRERRLPPDDVFNNRRHQMRRPSGRNADSSATGIWSGDGNGRGNSRRDDGRERRDGPGGGRYSEGRKRGNQDEEGRPPAENKRPRRTGP